MYLPQCFGAVGWAAERASGLQKLSGEVWHGHLSGTRCRWSAYGPGDATATPSSLAPVKSRMVYLSGAGLPKLSWKRLLNGCSSVVVVLVSERLYEDSADGTEMMQVTWLKRTLASSP